MAAPDFLCVPVTREVNNKEINSDTVNCRSTPGHSPVTAMVAVADHHCHSSFLLTQRPPSMQVSTTAVPALPLPRQSVSQCTCTWCCLLGLFRHGIKNKQWRGGMNLDRTLGNLETQDNE